MLSGLLGYNKKDVLNLNGKPTTRDERYMGGVNALAIPITAAVGAEMKATQEVLSPNEIHFMQSSIKNITGQFAVLENAQALKSGTLDPNILRMNVWKDATGKI